MCKHVAAVLYGVGARLDNDPAKLFLLRGVNHEELIDIPSAVIDATTKGKSRRRIDDSALSGIFDIDLPASEIITSPVANTTVKKTKSTKKQTVNAKNISSNIKRNKPKKKASQMPKSLSGYALRKRRKMLNLTQAAFAKKIGVSASTISKWENMGRKKINLNADRQKILQKMLL